MEFLLNVIDTALGATSNRCHIFLTVFYTLLQVIHFIAILGELIETELKFFGLAVDLVLGAFDCAETRQGVLNPNSINEHNENRHIEYNRCKSKNRSSDLLVVDRLCQLCNQVPQLVLEIKDCLLGQLSLAAHQWKRLRA